MLSGSFLSPFYSKKLFLDKLMIVPFHCVFEPCAGALTIADLKEAAVEDCKEFLKVLVLVFN